MTLKQKDFKTFKKYVEYYLEKYNLKEFFDVKIDFIDSHGRFRNAISDVAWYNGCATISLIKNDYIAVRETIDEDLKLSAKHEVCHLLTAKLYDLAQSRYTVPNELRVANEELVRKLEKILKD